MLIAVLGVGFYGKIMSQPVLPAYCWIFLICSMYQFSSVAQSFLTLCEPMDCSTPGFHAHHQLPGLSQTHVHRVDDTIHPSHSLLPLLLLPSIFPSITVFSKKSGLHIRWPNYWSFSINLSNEYSGWISLGLTGLISLQSKGLSRGLFNTTVQKHQFFGTQLSLWSNSHIHM